MACAGHNFKLNFNPEAPTMQSKMSPPFRTLRKTAIYIFLANLSVICLLVWSLEPLITLLRKNNDLFQPGNPFAKDQVHPTTPLSPELENNMVPRILHQTCATDHIPDKWKDSQQSCKNAYADFEYILWTDDKAREFISNHYSWFLKYWDSYAFPIQRGDSIRYFALYHFGGVYLDMDMWCNNSYPVDQIERDAAGHSSVFKATVPTGVTNDFMISTAKHPAFKEVIWRLPEFYSITRFWAHLQPYCNIMLSSGPLFLSLVLKDFLLNQPSLPSMAVHVVDRTELTPYIIHLQSSTWHGADARALIWLGDRPWTWFALGLVGMAMGLWLISRTLLFIFRTIREDVSLAENQDKLIKVA